MHSLELLVYPEPPGYPHHPLFVSVRTIVTGRERERARGGSSDCERDRGTHCEGGGVREREREGEGERNDRESAFD